MSFQEDSKAIIQTTCVKFTLGPSFAVVVVVVIFVVILLYLKITQLRRDMLRDVLNRTIQISIFNRVARFRHGKYGRLKENGDFYAKLHRTYM